MRTIRSRLALLTVACMSMAPFLVWTSPARGGDVYRWYAGDGSVHFTDIPVAPGAERYEPGKAMSVVEVVPTTRRPLSAALQREIRWQQDGHREAAREFAAETKRRETQCAKLRKELEKVESRRAGGKASDRRRVRMRDLEDRLFSECR